MTTVNYGGVDPDNPGEASPYPAEAVYGLNPAAEIPASGPFYCYDPTSDPDHRNYTTCSNTNLPTYQNVNCTYNGAAPGVSVGGILQGATQTLNRWNVTNEVKYRTKHYR